METALLSYFIVDDSLRSVCDFNPWTLEKGVSIYEVIRVENGLPLFLDEHINRFFQSALLENRKLAYDQKDIKVRIRALITENRFLFGNIKFLYHWTEEGSGQFFAWIMPYFYPSSKQYQQGVSVGLMRAERPNPNAKKALYELRNQADKVRSKHKYFEVVYVSPENYLTEGSRSNLFFISEGKIITPEVAMVLPGVTRAKILELSHARNIPVSETKVLEKEVNGFQSCFLTGTSIKVLPVTRLNDFYFDTQDPLLLSIKKAYDTLCDEFKKNFSWD